MVARARTICGAWTPRWIQTIYPPAMPGGFAPHAFCDKCVQIVIILGVFSPSFYDFVQKPPSKPPVSLKFMAPLIDHVQTGLPAEFQLPQDLRTFFKDGRYCPNFAKTPPLTRPYSCYGTEGHIRGQFRGERTSAEVRFSTFLFEFC